MGCPKGIVSGWRIKTLNEWFSIDIYPMSELLSCMIKIVELPTFTKAIKKLFSEDDKKRLYKVLSQSPEQGDIIVGTSGVRKMRFAQGNQGKRGGSRVIYYYYVSESEILMITAYAKNQQEDLTEDQKKAMRNLIKQLKET